MYVLIAYAVCACLLSDHALEIESGRWERIDAEFRCSKACWNIDIAVIGNEWHCLDSCIRCTRERNSFLDKTFVILRKSYVSIIDYLYDNSNGEYLGLAGPYDSFSIHFKWKAERYLAVDQGTIGPMIENHKTLYILLVDPDFHKGV